MPLQLLRVAFLFVGLVAAGAARAGSVDWDAVGEIAPGVKYKSFEVASPRLMKCYLARVDLMRNDLVSSECGQRRERTLAFAERLSAGGTNVVLAVNACPWNGGCGEGASITNFTLDGVNVQNGRVATDKPVTGWFDGFFALRQSGMPEILDAPPIRPLGDYRIVLNGYACILKDGKPFNRRKEVDLHPRTVIGVSKDRRYVYLLAVDGRQPGWSLGADYEDEARLMLEAGAWEAANMDGGGSTTVVCRDPSTGKLGMRNRHDPLGRYSRAVAINLAVVPKGDGRAPVGQGSAGRLALYNIVPYAPGREAETAKDIREAHATAGLDTFLYCVSLDPRGYPAFDQVTAATASYRKLSAELGDAPVKLGFLLQSILGHWPRVDKEIEPWQRSVDEDGNVKRFCLLDVRYQDYIRKTAAALAAERPCFILGDDDIRAFSPRLECFCPLHTAEFNRRAGTDFTPEQYRAAVKACKDGDKVATVCAQLRDEITMTTARLIREGIDSVDPKIPAGACMPGAETLLPAPRVALLAGAGNLKTLRFANGQYSEMGRADFVYNSLLTQAYLAHFGDRIDRMLDESDTFPHTLYARSGRSFVAKLALNVFNGIRGAKLWFVGMHKQTERVPAAYDRELGLALPQLEALAAALDGSAPLGVRIPAFYRPPALRAGGPNFFGDLKWQGQMLGVYGIPFYADFSRDAGAPVMLCGADTVASLGDGDLKAVFAGRAFVDGPASLALAKRGFAKELGCRPVADGRAFNIEEVKASGMRPPMAKTAGFPALTEPAANALVYSELRYSPAGPADPAAALVAPAALCAENPEGGRTFTAAFDPALYYNNQNLRRKAWLVGALRTLDAQFPVVCENEEPNLTLARRGRDGKTYVLTLNCGYDDFVSTRYSAAKPMAGAEVLDKDGVWRPAGATSGNGVWTVPGTVPCMRYRIVRW